MYKQRTLALELVFLPVADGEYLFVDLESKLSKYAPKNWRSSHTYVSVPAVYIYIYMYMLLVWVRVCVYIHELGGV